MDFIPLKAYERLDALDTSWWRLWSRIFFPLAENGVVARLRNVEYFYIFYKFYISILTMNSVQEEPLHHHHDSLPSLYMQSLNLAASGTEKTKVMWMWLCVLVVAEWDGLEVTAKVRHTICFPISWWESWYCHRKTGPGQPTEPDFALRSFSFPPPPVHTLFCFQFECTILLLWPRSFRAHFQDKDRE